MRYFTSYADYYFFEYTPIGTIKHTPIFRTRPLGDRITVEKLPDKNLFCDIRSLKFMQRTPYSGVKIILGYSGSALAVHRHIK